MWTLALLAPQVQIDLVDVKVLTRKQKPLVYKPVVFNTDNEYINLNLTWLDV